MHISHDFIATKTCPTYEFLVIFGQGAGLRSKKCGRWLGWSARRGGLEVCWCEAGKISQTYAGAGRERTKKFNRAGLFARQADRNGETVEALP